MIKMLAVESSTNPVSQVLSGKSSIRLDNAAFAMNPFGFNWIEPGAFYRQETYQEANAIPGSFDGAIMFTNPGPHDLTDMPTRIIPNHRQHRMTQLLDFLTGPFQELNGDGTHRSAIHETQEHFFHDEFICSHPAQQHAITSQRFRVRVFFLFVLFHQAQRLLLITPTRQVRLSKPAPPSFILEAPNPTILLGQGNQSVTRLFLRSYAGSGLVIQCLARFQVIFKRFKARRTLSPLTKRGVMPSAKLTSAASSSVQTLVPFPNSRGLRWSSAFNCSWRSTVKIGWAVFGRREPIAKAATPRSLKATITLRTVWSSQPMNSAIRGALSPRELARRYLAPSCYEWLF